MCNFTVATRTYHMYSYRLSVESIVKEQKFKSTYRFCKFYMIQESITQLHLCSQVGPSLKIVSSKFVLSV